MARLSSFEKRELRSELHKLNPVVIIGQSGLTPAVLFEIDRALNDHELIKVRLNGVDRNAREELVKKICESLKATLIQSVGFIVALWRKSNNKAE